MAHYEKADNRGCNVKHSDTIEFIPAGFSVDKKGRKGGVKLLARASFGLFPRNI